MKKARNGNIELLRFVFCVGVVLFHAWYVRRGYIGVEFFFIVTGYFLAEKICRLNARETTCPSLENAMKEATWDVLKRYRLIFPYFLVATVLGFIVRAYAQQWDSATILLNLQLIPADGAVAEASPGQFEINLYHTDNVLEACDDALALKRLVRLMAEKHKMHATFMAKPYEEHAGSGMHIHISMQNNRGENVLSDAEGEDSPLLKKMLAGMIDLMPSSMALLAPNVNSYRRFQPGMYVPTQASWGHNNRTVALRIPCGDRHNHRVEYRVAGADANPYLVMAAIFAGILHGLDNELPLQEEVEGNGLEQEGLPFPIRQSDALGEFIENDHLRRYLGERFCHVYHACKNDELLQFERLITETEIEWMLKNA